MHCFRNSAGEVAAARLFPTAFGLDRLSILIRCDTNKKVRSRRPSFRAANAKVTQTYRPGKCDNAGKAGALISGYVMIYASVYTRWIDMSGGICA